MTHYLVVFKFPSLWLGFLTSYIFRFTHAVLSHWELVLSVLCVLSKLVRSSYLKTVCCRCSLSFPSALSVHSPSGWHHSVVTFLVISFVYTFSCNSLSSIIACVVFRLNTYRSWWLVLNKYLLCSHNIYFFNIWIDFFFLFDTEHV